MTQLLNSDKNEESENQMSDTKNYFLTEHARQKTLSREQNLLLV